MDNHPAAARVHIGYGKWAILRASRMDSAGSGGTPPLAVTIQECPPEARLDIFARSFGLTPRQRELLELAAAGADTVAMAAAQGIGTYTVQDQFKQVFDNCGVHSRASYWPWRWGVVADVSQPATARVQSQAASSAARRLPRTPAAKRQAVANVL